MDANGCESQGQMFVVQNVPIMKVNVEVLENNHCYGVADAVVEVIVTDGGIAPFYYSLNGSPADTAYIFTLGAGTHTVTVFDYTGCIVDYTFTIESAPQIILEVKEQLPANCIGTEGGLVDIGVSGGQYPYIYQWSNNIQTSTISNLSAGIYQLTVTDAYGCTVSEQYEILPGTAEKELKINNAFSPNGDGINDVWVIENLELYPENNLVVLNRWGNEVYSVNPYNNDWSGSDLAEGTYFYILNVNMCNVNKTIKNYITIIR